MGVLAVLFVVTTPAVAQTPQDLARQTLPSVVMIVMEDALGARIGQGSGFFVAADVVVTNFHVIKGAPRGHVALTGVPGKYQIAGVVSVDQPHDLAALKIAGVKGAPLRLGDTAPVVIGDEVYALGNPRGLEGTFSQGIVSAVREVESTAVVQITVPVSPGSSGGPLINRKGEVIGVVTSGVRDGQNLNFAVRAAYLPPLLSQPNALLPLPVGGEATALSAEEREWRGKIFLEIQTASATQAECMLVLERAEATRDGALANGRLREAAVAAEIAREKAQCVKTMSEHLFTLRALLARGAKGTSADADRTKDSYHRELAVLLQGLQRVAPQVGAESSFTYEAFARMVEGFERDFDGFRKRHARFLTPGEASELATTVVEASSVLIASHRTWGREVYARREAAEIKHQIASAERRGDLSLADRAMLRQHRESLPVTLSRGEQAAGARLQEWATFQRLVKQASALAASGAR
jgi:S1-C subfamily serine protease